MEIVLKSSSPRRFDLLKSKGYSFEVKVYEVDETIDENISAYFICEREFFYIS